LEDDFAVILVNAAHVKHVPGRKTDTIDAVWLAQPVAHGLLSPSFVPPPPIRALRDLTRYRKALINERTAQVNRTDKVLQDAGIKIATFVSDIMGVSARAMMRSLIAGEHDPALLADLAKGRMRAKIPDLNKALTGRFGEHHAFLLRRMLDHIEAQEAEIAELDARIKELISPFAAQVQLLATIPGVDRRSAETILAEIGPDMRVFPTPGHLASWAGMCPGQRDSAGKRGSGRTRKGSKWLPATLVQSGRAATRTKSTYLHERSPDPSPSRRRPCRGRGRPRDPDRRLRCLGRRRALSRPGPGQPHRTDRRTRTSTRSAHPEATRLPRDVGTACLGCVSIRLTVLF
jgi:transposase